MKHIEIANAVRAGFGIAWSAMSKSACDAVLKAAFDINDLEERPKDAIRKAFMWREDIADAFKAMWITDSPYLDAGFDAIHSDGTQGVEDATLAAIEIVLSNVLGFD